MSPRWAVDKMSTKGGPTATDRDKKGPASVTDTDTKRQAASSDNEKASGKTSKNEVKSKVSGREEERKQQPPSSDKDTEKTSKKDEKSKIDVVEEDKKKRQPPSSEGGKAAETIKKKDRLPELKRLNPPSSEDVNVAEKTSQKGGKSNKLYHGERKLKRLHPPSSEGDKASDKTSKKGGKSNNLDLGERRKRKRQAPSSEGDNARGAIKSPDETEKTRKTSKKGGESSGAVGSDNEEQQPMLTAIETEYEARFTYEQVMQRYGNWKMVRNNVICYILILYCAIFLKSFSDLLTMIKRMGTIVRDEGIGCCCNRDRVPEIETAQKLLNEVDIENVLGTASIVLGIASPLFEQYLGRRQSILGGLTIGTILSAIIAMTTNLLVHKICFCVKVVADLLVMLVCLTTVIELVPYNLRVLGPLTLCMGQAMGMGLNSIFLLRLSVAHYGIVHAAISFGALLLAFFYTKDSICHLIASRRLEQAEQMITDLEIEQAAASSSEHSDKFHERAAKKIFEDLAYPDRDELQILSFLRRLFRSWKAWEIIILVIQSLSCGFIEFETLRMYAERFARPKAQIVDRLIAYSVSFALFFLFRKQVLAHILSHCADQTTYTANRIKVMTMTLGLILLILSLRKSVMVHNKRNECGNHLFCEEHFEWFSLFTNISGCALLYTYQMLILLHFMEIAPTSLRLSCIILVFVPMNFAFRLGYHILEKYKELGDYTYPIYIIHFAALIILLLRNTKMKSALSIYFIDLIPEEPSCREVDGEELAEGTPRAYDSKKKLKKKRLAF